MKRKNRETYNTKKSSSLTSEVLVATIGAIIALFIGFGLLSVYRFNQFIEEQYFGHARNASELIGKVIEDASTSMNFCTQSMAKSDVLMKALVTKDMESANTILTELTHHIQGAENIFICKVTAHNSFKIIAGAMDEAIGFEFGKEGDYHENLQAALDDETCTSYPSQSPVSRRTVLLSTTPFHIPGNTGRYAMCYSKYMDADIQAVIKSFKIGDSGYSFVMRTTDGMTIAHPDTSINWNVAAHQLNFPSNIFDTESNSKAMSYVFKGEEKILVPYINQELKFAAFGSFKKAELWTYIKQVIVLNVVMLLVILVVIALLNWQIFKWKFKPLYASENVLTALSEGDLTNRLEKITGNNEVSRMAHSLNATLDIVGNLISQTKESIKQLKAGSHELSKASNVISEGAALQAANVEEVATTIEEENATVAQTSESAMNNLNLVTGINQEIKGLDISSREAADQAKIMAGFLENIAELANQIKLLSLNAAIESAKAGEYGRGFSVIAAEVRKLSENSQELTGNMTEISNILLEKASETKLACERIVPMLKTNHDSTNEIYVSSQEQRTSMEQISSAINELNRITQTNSSTAEELSANAEELSGQTEQLSELISFFKDGNDDGMHQLSERRKIEEETERIDSKNVAFNQKSKEMDVFIGPAAEMSKEYESF